MHTTSLFLIAVGLFASASRFAEAQPAPFPASPEEPRFTEQPGEPTGALALLLAKTRAALEEGSTDVSAVLCDPALVPLHEFTAFRWLVRDHARLSKVSIAPTDEPGARMVVSGRVVDAEGAPIAGALLYAYQTSAKGWYSDRAPHFGGTAGDVQHARLFGYLRTDADGRFELTTIRPGGYPKSDLPEHIHVDWSADGFEPHVTEVVFEDDPRLTPERRAQALRDGYAVRPVTKDAAGVLHCDATFVLERDT